MPGPPPNEHKRRRNADAYAGLHSTVVDDGEITGPALEGASWSAAARSYWDIWRRSPQAKAFLDTDWARLRMVLLLVEDYLKHPTAQKLTAISSNEGSLGATVADRLRLRMRVVRPSDPDEAEVPAGVTALDEYRKSLAG
jgi:hypothetical protein